MRAWLSEVLEYISEIRILLSANPVMYVRGKTAAA